MIESVAVPLTDAMIGPYLVYGPQPYIQCSQPKLCNNPESCTCNGKYCNCDTPMDINHLVYNPCNCYLGFHYLYRNRLPEHEQNRHEVSSCTSYGCAPGQLPSGSYKKALIISSRAVAKANAQLRKGPIDKIAIFVYNAYANPARERLCLTFFPVLSTNYPEEETIFLEQPAYLCAAGDHRKSYTAMIKDSLEHQGEFRAVQLQLATASQPMEQMIAPQDGRQLLGAMTSSRNSVVLLQCELSKAMTDDEDSGSGSGGECDSFVVPDHGSGSGSGESAAGGVSSPASVDHSGSGSGTVSSVITRSLMLVGLKAGERKPHIITSSPIYVEGQLQLENLVWLSNSDQPAIILANKGVLTTLGVQWKTKTFPVLTSSSSSESLYIASGSSTDAHLNEKQIALLPCLALQGSDFGDAETLGLDSTYMRNYQTNCDEETIEALQAELVYAPGVDLDDQVSPPPRTLQNTVFLETDYSKSYYFYLNSYNFSCSASEHQSGICTRFGPARPPEPTGETTTDTPSPTSTSEDVSSQSAYLFPTSIVIYTAGPSLNSTSMPTPVPVNPGVDYVAIIVGATVPVLVITAIGIIVVAGLYGIYHSGGSGDGSASDTIELKAYWD